MKHRRFNYFITPRRKSFHSKMSGHLFFPQLAPSAKPKRFVKRASPHLKMMSLIIKIMAMAVFTMMKS